MSCNVYGARPFLWYGPQECLEADGANIVMTNADPEPKQMQVHSKDQ